MRERVITDAWARSGWHGYRKGGSETAVPGNSRRLQQRLNRRAGALHASRPGPHSQRLQSKCLAKARLGLLLIAEAAADGLLSNVQSLFALFLFRRV